MTTAVTVAQNSVARRARCLVEWTMTELVPPDLRWHESWAATLAEFDGDFPHGSGCPPEGQPLDRDSCAALVTDLLRYGDDAAELPDHRVHCDYFWIVDGGEVIGFLALRHRLNDYLLREGGHIGYSVRPSRRREGHATRALALALPRAASLGLEEVLVTCDEDNDGSRLVIERAGGVLEDVRVGKRRYWIPTGAHRPDSDRASGGASRGPGAATVRPGPRPSSVRTPAG